MYVLDMYMIPNLLSIYEITTLICLVIIVPFTTTRGRNLSYIEQVVAMLSRIGRLNCQLEIVLTFWVKRKL